MKNKLLKLITITLIAIFIIVISVIVLDKINYKCFYQELFNITCAGCGFTRMLKSIYYLDFYQAFRYNPLMFILLIIVLIVAIINCIRYLLNKKMIKISYKVFIALAIILIVYMILRNIQGLDFLKPTEVR